MAEDPDTSMRLTRSVFPEATEVNEQRNGKASSRNNLQYGFTGVPSNYKLSKRLTRLNMNNMELNSAAATGEAEDKVVANALTASILVSGFMEFTTSHGITHIYNARGLIKKCIWGILTLVSIVALALHLWLLIAGFISYGTITNVSIQESRAMDFPAVTFCNSNGIKRSNLPDWLDKLVKSKKQGILNGTDSTRSNKKVFKSMSEEISLLSTSAKTNLGFNYSDLVIYCTYDGENCDSETFWTHFDSTYGNCYTFNTGKYSTIEQSNIAGPSNGLTLVLNIELYEYLKFLTEDSGVKVVIHDQKAMPFPAHNSISVSPGQVNNIAIKMLNTTRLASNYGNCTKLDMNQENMYFNPYNVSYTQWACLNTCYQKELVRVCKCFDPDLPYDSGTPVFDQIQKANGPCRLTNSTNVACISEISNMFADRSLACDTCYQPCSEITYEGSLSTSNFPALTYIDDFIMVLNASNPALVNKLVDEYGSGKINTGIQSNFLKLNVYYQSMTYTSHEQVPSYDNYQFASDVGGAWGLWIGWSCLTIFELIEFAIDLIVYACYGSACKSARTNA